MKKNMTNNKKHVDEATISSPILFDGKMRKMFIKGILQDIKGYFEMVSGNNVEITYDEYDMKLHEFGFKLNVAKCKNCSKQLFNEVSCALINVCNYMFQGNTEQYDMSICTNEENVEVEFVSNW